MKGFKMFGALSEKISTDDIKNPDVSKVDIKTTIKTMSLLLSDLNLKQQAFDQELKEQQDLMVN